MYVRTIVNVVDNFGMFLYSDTAHALPPEVAKAWADQGLSTDGGRAHSQPREAETTGTKEWGQPSELHVIMCVFYWCDVHVH